MAVNGVPQPSGSFVTFPPTNQVVTCIPNSQELQMDGVQESKVFVTVAVHPGPTPTAVQPAGSLVAPNGFINGNSIYPPNVQPPPNSQIQTDANYNYMGPTHPINRLGLAKIILWRYLYAFIDQAGFQFLLVSELSLVRYQNCLELHQLQLNGC